MLRRYLWSLAAVTILFAPAGALAQSTLQRISVAVDGTEGNGNSGPQAISDDGRYMAFLSDASNLDPADVDGARDAYLYDRLAGSLTLISDGTDNVYIQSIAISGDGGTVVYSAGDIIAYDVSTGLRTILTIGWDGSPANNTSESPAVNVDGSIVAFVSRATNLVPAGPSGYHIYALDRTTGAIELVSQSSAGDVGNDYSGWPSLDGSGDLVAFQSRATNLVNDDTNGREDVFVRRRSTGDLWRASVASDGSEGNGDSLTPILSSNGEFLIFESFADTLVAGDANSRWDTFVVALDTGAVEMVSLADGGSFGDLSADGNVAIYAVLAAPDFGVYSYDRTTGTRRQVFAGYPYNLPVASADGAVTAFDTGFAITPDDTNGFRDVFVHEFFSPDSAIEDLVAAVTALESSGALRRQDARQLIAKLQSALAAAQRSNNVAAANKLLAFIRAVEALDRSRRLGKAEAEALVAAADAIVESLLGS